MSIKLTLSQIEQLAPYVHEPEETGLTEVECFKKTAIDAITAKLAEDYPGWNTYDITKIENMFPTYFYQLTLDDKNYKTLFLVSAYIDTESKTVEFAVYPA